MELTSNPSQPVTPRPSRGVRSRRPTPHDLTALLTDLRARGVAVWVAGGEVRVSAPDRLTTADRTHLVEARRALLQMARIVPTVVALDQGAVE